MVAGSSAEESWGFHPTNAPRQEIRADQAVPAAPLLGRRLHPQPVAGVRELNPDVVILDFQIPVMNGLDAARRIAASAPNTAIVMLTIHSSEQLQKDAQAAGIEYFFSKSNPDLLFASLSQLGAGPGPTRVKGAQPRRQAGR